MSRGEKSRKNFKFDSILDNKIFQCELHNVAKHCAISSECSSPSWPKRLQFSFIHSTPTACSFPPRWRENNTSRMWTSICAVSELLRQQPGCFIRPTFLGRTPTPPMPTRLLPLSIASPRQRSGEILLISPLSVTVPSTIASSTSFCAALFASLNHFRARSISASKVVPSKSR